MHALTCHADSACGLPLRLLAEARMDGDRLSLAYRAEGDVGAIRLPEPEAPERADGLWRTTCFEAFLDAGDGGYVELNLSPAGRWAAYRFDAYREGMRPLDLAPPRIAFSKGERRLELRADVKGLAFRPRRLGLAAVIEEAAGGKSYWALAHAAAKPDFHHPDSFIGEIS